MSILKNLTTKHKDAFKWSGEINVFKHALAANGFFDGGERVTLERVQKGALDEYFRVSKVSKKSPHLLSTSYVSPEMSHKNLYTAGINCASLEC